MCKTYSFILAVLFTECLSENAHKETALPASGSDASLFNLLSGNGLYNPMDPMGFIFQGNSEQFKGNGIDTPKYNPDTFAYRYAGSEFGLGENPFVPNFINSMSINNSPNYAQDSKTTQPPHQANDTNQRDDEKNVTTSKEDGTFLHMPAIFGSSLKPESPEFASQTFPENIMAMLKMNASDMFPDASFNGRPGMLGVGEQLPVHTVKPDQGPVPQRQYLPSALRNISETLMLSPKYDGFPGMEGTQQQTVAEMIRLDTSTPNPLYRGYPGMLGTGSMSDNFGNSNHKDSRQDSSSLGYSNQDRAESGYRNNYISSVPGVNTNNWKGEWPGKTSVGGDWSGDWTDKWPKTSSSEKENRNGVDASTFGSSDSQSSSHVNWDGSWPGSTKKDGEISESTSDFVFGNRSTACRCLNPAITEIIPTLEQIELLFLASKLLVAIYVYWNLEETMAALEKIMNMLNGIPHTADKSTSGSSPTSFSQMVSSWKEDMKH